MNLQEELITEIKKADEIALAATCAFAKGLAEGQDAADALQAANTILVGNGRRAITLEEITATA